MKKILSGLVRPTIIALVLVPIISIMVVSIVVASSGNDAPITYELKDPAILHGNILNSFKKDFLMCYDALFGGAYANDKLQLVVGINANEITDEIRSEFDQRAGLTEAGGKKAMDFVTGEFSYQHLLGTYELMNQYLENTPKENWIPFNGFWIDDELNRVVISIPALTNEIVERLKNEVIDDKSVLIIEALEEYMVANFVAVTPGNGISTDLGTLTIGFRCDTWNGHVGFVTAGHGFPSGSYAWECDGKPAYLPGSSTVFGYVESSFIGLSLDAAFVVPTAGNSVNLNTLHTSNICTPVSGDIVYKKGITTGTTSGTVTCNNYTAPDGSYRLIRVGSPIATYGDSGGPAWLPNYSTNPMFSTPTIGIVRGGEIIIVDGVEIGVSTLFTSAYWIHVGINELSPTYP